mmetsp:Transcript_30967/g.68609  ORF Transcript_30967/g.68609 Transcript_30967/m.68609 type:complete len:382 (+) Transcript_30967:207-1352(+)
MQSHASRHVVSEFLKDLHPDQSPPFPKGIIQDEIAVAYGRRGITKLIAVLALPAHELPDTERAHALRVFNGLLSTQEQKTDAINAGAAAPLTQLVNSSQDAEVMRLSCEALGSLAQILPGRVSIVNVEGLKALTEALTKSPEAAAGALRQYSNSNDGVGLLSKELPMVVPALVTLINSPKEDGISIRACENAAATLAGIASTDKGIVSCLEFKVAKSIVDLIQRGQDGDYRFEATLLECWEQCALCLEQICHHPYGKTAVREADGVKALGTLLTSAAFHPSTVKRTTSALMAISIEKESKVLVVVFGGTALIKLLKSDDPELAANARAVLQSSAEHLDARKLLSTLLPPAEQEKLVYQGPLPSAPPDFRYKVVLPYGTGTA